MHNKKQSSFLTPVDQLFQLKETYDVNLYGQKKSRNWINEGVSQRLFQIILKER